MYTAGLVFGLMLVPLGYYLVIEAPDFIYRLIGYVSIVAGITLFMSGWLKSIKLEKENNESNRERFNELIKEL